jgi:hypothetical protein
VPVLTAPVEYTDGKATIAIGVDKVDEARRVLSDQLIEWKVPETVHAGMSRQVHSPSDVAPCRPARHGVVMSAR